jgi:putative resolvase
VSNIEVCGWRPFDLYQVQGFDLYTYATKSSRIVDNLPVLSYPVGMKLSAYAKQQGISYQTAWRMWQRGELPAHQLPSGTVIVDVPPTSPAVRPQKMAVYARVSSTENRKNLDSQAERVAAFCAVRGWQVAKVVKEYGSGVNDQRPQLLALLADPSVSHIVVEHKDRCSRFGVAYIQTLLKTQGRELVIINEAEEDQEEFVDELASVIRKYKLWPTLRKKMADP